MLVLGGAGTARAQVRASEAQVEAVFLYNFARFVTWPESAFANARAPLVICVLGRDRFGGFLDETVRGEHVDEHPLQVQRVQRADQAAECQILYLARPDAELFDAVRAATRNRPVLTVSNDGGFAERGGTIEFVTDGGRVRLRINLRTARTGNLTISSKLLRAAEVVGAGGR